MSSASEWRSRPVFVSSTFLDMQAERDFLRDVVFPELAERLLERRHELEAVDLRWGVETVNLDQEELRELHVLKVCLDEIRKSKPFLIVLIGDRYGWVPPEERMHQAVREAGYKTDCKGKSVTALEIEFGVLADKEQATRTYFYFREPLPYKTMRREVAAKYSDAYSRDPIVREHGVSALQDLREEIRGRFGVDRVKSYSVEWDAGKECVTGLEAWGNQVREDLWRDLDHVTEPYLRAKPATWQEAERRSLGDFVELRSAGFVGRQDLLGHLTSFALESTDSKAIRGCCITGEAGTGKSALFAKLFENLREKDCLVLGNAAGISERSGIVSALLLRWIEELAGVLRVDPPVTESATFDEMRSACSELLNRVAKSRRVVLLVDALNEFERTPAAMRLTWLPERLSANVRLIATAIPGAGSNSLAARDDTTEEKLGPLTERDARQIAAQTCLRYHKNLGEDGAVTDSLIGKKRANGSLAAANPLWLKMAVEELLMLDAEDFASAVGNYAGRDDEKIVFFMIDMVTKMPPEVDELYEHLLERMVETYGEAPVRAFTNLLTVSRAGWRQSDMEEMFPRLCGTDWDPLKFAILRRGFRAHVVQRGAPVRIDFYHTQMRQAVLRQWLDEEEARKRVHAIIVDRLEKLPASDPLRRAHYMHHLIGADDKKRAFEHYTIAQGDCKDAARSALASAILAGDRQSPNPGVEWAVALLNIHTGDNYGDPIRRQLICQDFSLSILDDLKREGVSSELCVDFLNRALPVIKEASQEETHDFLGGLLHEYGFMERGSTYGTALVELAKHLTALGRYDEALSKVTEGREYAERWYEKNSTRGQASVLEHALNAEADLLEILGRYDRALILRERVMEVMRDAPDGKRPLVKDESPVLALVGRIHHLLNTNLAAEAMKLYEENKSSFEQLLDTNWVEEHGEKAVKAGAIIGDLLAKQHRLTDAELFYEASIAVAKKRYLESPVPSNAENLLASTERLARGLAQMGEFAQAAKVCDRAVNLHRERCDRDPTRDHKHWLAAALKSLGSYCLGMEDTAVAREHLQEAHDICEQLYESAPSGSAFEDVALSYITLSLAQPSQKERLRCLLRAERMFGSLAKNGLLTNPQTGMAFLMAAQATQKAPKEIMDELRAEEEDRSFDVKAKWLTDLHDTEEERASIVKVNLPGMEAEHAQEPTAERAQRLLSSYALITYRARLAGWETDEKEFAVKAVILGRWMKGKGMAFQKDGQGLLDVLEIGIDRHGVNMEALAASAMNGVILSESVNKALVSGNREDVLLAVTLQQERVAREEQLDAALAMVLRRKGGILLATRQSEEAAKAYEEAAERYAAQDDSKALSATLGDLVRVYRAMEDTSQTMRTLRRQAEVLNSLHDMDGLTNNHLVQVEVLIGAGEYDEVESVIEHGLALTQQTGDSVRENTLLGNWSLLLRHRGDYDGSLRLLRQTATYFRQHKEWNMLASSLINEATLLSDKLGRHDEAAPIAEEALAVARKSRNGDLTQRIAELSEEIQEKADDKAEQERAAQEAKSEVERMESEFARGKSIEAAYTLGEAYWNLLNAESWSPETRSDKRRLEHKLLEILEWIEGQGGDLGDAEIILKGLRKLYRRLL